MFFKLKYAVIIISYNFLGLVSYPANEYEGTECGEGNTRGSCKTVRDCPIAQKKLKETRVHGFERCGFDGILEVVCCPTNQEEKPSVINHSNTNQEGNVWTDPDEKTTKPEVRAPVITRKSEIACREYSNEVPADPTFQILGGENVTLGEFPHMAALGYENEESTGLNWECGGSLISNRFVLTAAHCIIKQDRITPTKVRLGIVDLTGSDNVEPKDYGIFNITVHHDYQRRTKINDLALIKLDSDVSNSNFVHPACLYQQNDDPLGLVITGWGYTTAGGEPSTILQKAKLHSVDVSECSSVYESRLQRSIISSQMCAVSDDGTKDTCQGDSGGPLQAQQRDGSSIYSIVGITSYGMGCGGKTPGIYTRVSSYLDWIENLVWP